MKNNDLSFDQNRLMRLMVESATDFAMLATDCNGIIKSWNSGAKSLMGWTEQEAFGQHGRLIYTPEDREAGSPEKEMQRAVTDGRAVNERWHLRKDGSRFWGSGLLMPLNDEAGTHAGFVKMMRDRTAEREAERRYQMLTDLLPGFVFVCDTDGQNVQVNARYREYTGLSEPELLGDGWMQVLHPNDRSRAEEIWGRAVASGEPYEGDYRFRGADGSYRHFACRGRPEIDGEGRILRWMGTCVDAEAQSLSRAALEGLTRDLEHAATDAQVTLQAEAAARTRAEDALRQSQKMEAIGQLTGGVAHDFNNLLTVIRGSVDLLRRPDLPDEKRRRYIDAIGETADRAAHLTSQLLAFARRQPLQPLVFDAAARVQGLGDVLRTVSGSRVIVEIRLECEHCLVKADPNHLDTALVNMAVNARDAMSGEGELIITVREVVCIPPRRNHAETTGKFVAIEVSDQGAGIEANHLDHIFEPFFTTKEVGKGTGLGLSQVFGFAKQSGGEVLVDSRLEIGTTFTLYLPQAAELSLPAPEITAELSATTSERGCILVVEDNQLVGDFAAGLLEDMGHDSVWVSSAAAALEAMEEDASRFDLVFTDVVMPGMNGVDLATELRRRHSELPIVLTSGYSHVLAEQGTHGFELLQKPYTAEALSRVLQRARNKHTEEE